MVEKVALEIKDITRPKGVFSRATIAKAIRDGKLTARRNGRRVVILPEDYYEFLRSLPLASDTHNKAA